MAHNPLSTTTSETTEGAGDLAWSGFVDRVF